MTKTVSIINFDCLHNWKKKKSIWNWIIKRKKKVKKNVACSLRVYSVRNSRVGITRVLVHGHSWQGKKKKKKKKKMKISGLRSVTNIIIKKTLLLLHTHELTKQIDNDYHHHAVKTIYMYCPDACEQLYIQHQKCAGCLCISATSHSPLRAFDVNVWSSLFCLFCCRPIIYHALGNM